MFGTTEAEMIGMLKVPLSKDKGFIKLMDLYKEPIYWHIRRLVVSHEDAQDILQETFIQVYKYSDSFKGDSKLFTWLYRIATNECTRHFRKNKQRLKRTGFLEESQIREATVSDMADSKAILQKFQLAILQLPEKQRIVFNLRYYDELSYEDISQILNSSVNTLKTNYHYASEKIKNYLIEHA